MRDIVKFTNYKGLKEEITSGIVFIYRGKIMLVHPTGEGLFRTFSYPKGKVDFGESIQDAAVREVEEEIGTRVDRNLLTDDNLYKMSSVDSRRNILKTSYYYLINIDEDMFNEIFQNNMKIKKKRLPIHEIDWAGFMDRDEASRRIKPRLRKVLRHI